MEPAPPQPPKSRRKTVLLAVLGVAGFLLFCTCSSCILWVTARDEAERSTAAVGMAQELLALRAELDRVHDTFPASPAVAACAEQTPPEEVPVLTMDQLDAFRVGEGYGDITTSELDLSSTHLAGNHRPADGITDDEAYDALDTLVSPLRTIRRSAWLAVIRTNDAAMPAVTFNVFTPGHHRGDLVVFDRATGRVLCAQPLTATNSPSFDVGSFESGAEAGRADLRDQVSASKERARLALSPTLQFEW